MIHVYKTKGNVSYFTKVETKKVDKELEIIDFDLNITLFRLSKITVTFYQDYFNEELLAYIHEIKTYMFYDKRDLRKRKIWSMLMSKPIYKFNFKHDMYFWANKQHIATIPRNTSCQYDPDNYLLYVHDNSQIYCFWNVYLLDKNYIIGG